MWVLVSSPQMRHSVTRLRLTLDMSVSGVRLIVSVDVEAVEVETVEVEEAKAASTLR